MSEELLESMSILYKEGNMTKRNIEIIKQVKKYIEQLEREIDALKKENDKLEDFNEELMEERNILHSIIKEVREYITSYESIETIQQFDHNKNNKDLDYSTIDEMTRRYMIVHDKLLEIIDRS